MMIRQFSSCPENAAMHLPSAEALLHDPHWRRAWAWLWALQLLVVGVAALSPGDVAPTLSPSDKIDHLLAFAVLAATGMLAFRRQPSSLLVVAGALIAYGAGIELAQMHVPGRQGSFADLLADAAGVALGLGFVLLLRRHGPWARP